MPIYPVTAEAQGKSIRAKIAAPNGDPLCARLATGAFYEADLLDALAAEYVRHPAKGWILDVGGHIGNHTAFLAHFGPVIAFEADARCQAAWLKTMAYTAPPHPTVLVPRPAWSEAVPLHVSRNKTGRVHAVAAAANALAGRAQTAVTLDGIASGFHISIIKMDIEGGERHALRGARHILTRGEPALRPVLAVECKDAEALARVEAELQGTGYRRGKRYANMPTYLFHPGDAA